MDDVFLKTTHTQEDIEPQPSITFGEIFLQIWTSPRQVFRRIEETGYEKYLILLIILGSIDQAFDRAILKDMGDKLPFVYVIVICLLGGLILGWLGYFISAALLRWTGSWLGGEASFKSVLRVIGYATIPSIFSLAILSFQLVIFGESMFKSDEYHFSDEYLTNMLMLMLLLTTSIIQIGLSVWSFVMTINGLSVVHNFSRWKALGNVLLAIAVIVGILLLLIIPILMLYYFR